MDLFKGMRLVAFTSLTFGTTAFVVSAWLILTNRNLSASTHKTKDNGTNEISCLIQTGDHDPASANYQHTLLLRTCIVVVIVSLIQVLSGMAILASPLQGSRQRAKIWFGVNIGLNLILFLCFIVPLMNTKGHRSKTAEHPLLLADNGDGANCPWSMTSVRLDSFYVAVCVDFVVHFLVLVFSLMMLRYDENRDYELVALT